LDEISFGPKRDFRLHSRRWLVASGAAGLIAAAAVVAVTSGGRHHAVARPTVVSGGRHHAVAAPGPRAPQPLTVRVLGSISLPVSQSTGVALLGSTAWISDWYTGKVVAVDLVARRVIKVLRVGGPQDGPISVAAGAGSVWVLDFSTGRLLRIAARTGSVTGRILIRGEATDVAYGDGSVWVIADGRWNGTAEEHLYKIDPARDVIVRVAPIPGAGPGCAAFPGPRGVWVGCGGVAGISLIDPRSLRVVRRVPVDPGEYRPQIAPGRRVVWVLTAAGLVRVDPGTGKITAAGPTAWNPDAAAVPGLAVDASGRVYVAGSPVDVLVPGSLTVRPISRTAGVTSVVVAGPIVWADAGTTLVGLEVTVPAFRSR
jgi:hypothetical protein